MGWERESEGRKKNELGFLVDARGANTHGARIYRKHNRELAIWHEIACSLGPHENPRGKQRQAKIKQREKGKEKEGNEGKRGGKKRRRDARRRGSRDGRDAECCNWRQKAPLRVRCSRLI